MKFMNRKKTNEKKEEEKKHENDIEIVIGDNSTLEISDVGDCMNDLRPKDLENKKKGIVIPKAKKKDK